MLPKAKRDTSAAFKATLAADADTQRVLAEHREQLQGWLRPILRKARTGGNPNPKMTYRMWVDLMDGPNAEEKARDARAAKTQQSVTCPKQVGEWRCTQESEITGDERTTRKNQLHFKVALSIPQATMLSLTMTMTMIMPAIDLLMVRAVSITQERWERVTLTPALTLSAGAVELPALAVGRPARGRRSRPREE